MYTARFVMQIFGWAVGIPLEVLVLLALLRNGYRRYPVIFLFLLINFGTTLVQIPVLTHSFLARNKEVTRHAAIVYWICEGVLQFLIFATVFSLIDQALSMSRKTRMVRAGLAAGALLFAGVTFWTQYRPPPALVGVWMSPWTSEMSVCATVIDLALWMILIASRKSDRNLLLICGALGMQFTAEAIGEQLATIAVPRQSLLLALIGSVVAVAGNLICLYIWWQTFRTAKESSPLARQT